MNEGKGLTIKYFTIFDMTEKFSQRIKHILKRKTWTLLLDNVSVPLKDE